MKDEKLKIEIVEFFRNSQKFGNFHPNPNGEQLLNKDKPIIKKYFLNDDNIIIEIFNYPTLLRINNGFFNLINECSIIFNFFFKVV